MDSKKTMRKRSKKDTNQKTSTKLSRQESNNIVLVPDKTEVYEENNVKKYNNSALYENNGVYKLIDLYFRQKNIMYSHLHNSFDKFLEEDVRSLLRTGNNVFFEKITKDRVIRYKFEYDNISIKPPILDNEDELMFPSHARLRNLTYASKLVATIKQIQEVTDIATGKVKTKVIGQPEYEYPIAIIPTMVRSKYCSLNLKKNYDKSECEYDPGGYFIVNGSEKVVMSLERMIDNKPLVFVKKDSNMITHTVQVNSKSLTSGVNNDMVQIVTIKMKKDNSMVLRVQLLAEVPVFIVLRALGLESDKDIINYCAYDLNDTDMINLIRISLDETKYENSKVKIRSQEEAIAYLMNKMRVVKRYNETDKNIRYQEKRMHLMSLLKDNFLPHIEGDHLDKAFYMGYMINKLLQCKLGRIPVDDRDSFVNKRVDLPGTLMFELFKQFYKKMLNECSKFFKKRNSDDDNPQNIINQIKPNIIEQGLKASLLTGAWGKKKGVAQMLQRLTFLQTISSLRRINSPTVDASTNKLTSPRHLHGTQEGFLCVTGDTLVELSNGHNKPIKDLDPEKDMILTICPKTLQDEHTTFYNLFSRMPERLLKLTLYDGTVLKCTPEHPILINKGGYMNYEMREADKLTDRDFVIMYPKYDRLEYTENEYYSTVKNKTCVRIIKIEDIEPEIVYDLTTHSPYHSFLANRIVVSNCHVETPEGHKVGLVKNLSLIGNITIMLPSQPTLLRGIMRQHVRNIRDVPSENIINYTKVFLNGEWLGLTDRPRELYDKLKRMKYDINIDIQTGIVHEIKSEVEGDELRVSCDGGRIIKPVLRVVDNEILLNSKITDLIIDEEYKSTNPTKISSWNEFMIKNPGVVEFIDADEAFNGMIAMAPADVYSMRDKVKNSVKQIEKYPIKDNYEIVNRYDDTVYVYYTHCEIHPSLHLGVVAINSPFCNFNQGPRNMFQYSQARQAMGLYTSNYRDRLDISYILYNAQRPLVNTRFIKYVNTDKLAAGENSVVAIACYTGFNQEDSVIMNKSAIDRGFLRSTSLKKYMTDIKKNQSTSQDDLFIKPDPSKVTGMRHGSYDKLNEKGYIPEETEIYNGDIIIGKVSPINPVGQTNKTFKDSSEVYKSHVSGTVDKVYTDVYNNEGYEMRKMRIRSMRIPHIGDKVCSRHGQKGTIGITLPQADMPFTKDGITPDIIVNPNAIPSRMTLGQFVECLVGKISAIEGHESDGTPFNEVDIETLKDRLELLGYHRSGTEYLYNGMTGKKMKTMIFIGPTYYQRLKHMVSDKIHGRSRGPRTLLTRQPPEGRSREGGLRFGEMERDCIISHGMGRFLKERLLETADAYSTYVCNKCGLFAQRMLRKDNKPYETHRDIYHCPSCKNVTDIAKVRIPYAFKLLIQELMSMNIAPRIRVDLD